MNRFQRVTIGVFAKIDEMIAQIENHDAIVNSTLLDIRHAAASAKVQLGKVQRDGELLLQRIGMEHEAAKSWKARALACASEDETKALECLRRAKLAQQRAAQLEGRLPEHARIQKKLEKDIAEIQERLRELSEKQNLLRTRESRARALRELTNESQGVADLQSVFERWETNIAQTEHLSGCDDDTDALLEEFLSKEEEFSLRAELAALKQQPIE